MRRQRDDQRRIALFVEGDTETGEARRRTLPAFFHRWLDPQLPAGKRVGIQPVKFQGVSNYLDDLAKKVVIYLDEEKANYVVGLVDLYGIPSNRVDLSGCATVLEKVETARNVLTSLVPERFRDRFVQHFAVHEVEAWLLAYPNEWPAEIRDQVKKRPPEQVNFNEPPAKFLQRLLGRRYRKTVEAMNKFPRVDPQIAIDSCPNLRLLASDLLTIAKWLSSS
jgi:hypothetical protein